jgi:hypothetical protein
MTIETVHWNPDLPLPRNANRKTLAAIITHHYFPIGHRTLQTWPLTVRRPNRANIYDVQEAMEFAEKKLESSISYKQKVTIPA